MPRVRSDLSHMFSALFSHYKRALAEALKIRGYSLAPADIKVLGFLHENPGVSLQKLAAVTVKDKAQITRKVKELERKKILYRQKDSIDSRSYQLFLTQDGIQLQAQTMAIRAEVMQQLYGNLSISEQKQMLELLQKCLRDVLMEGLDD